MCQPSPHPTRHPTPEPAENAVSRLLADLHYDLPDQQIARHPPKQRDGGRLMVVGDGGLVDGTVRDLPSRLEPGDLLVVNDTRVVPARLFLSRSSGGRVEALVLPGSGSGSERLAMLRPGRRLSVGEVLQVEGGVGELRLSECLADGTWRVSIQPDPAYVMALAGHVPLPPYLRRPDEPADRDRYQTVYAGPPGAVAAPTAGLHLSRRLLAALAERGVGLAKVTLHVGPGTFRPLRAQDLSSGQLHAEAWWVSEQTAQAVVQTRSAGGRIVAVGTTATRVLESAALPGGVIAAGQGMTRLFLRPGSRFLVVDRLLTNFHLPGSSLLALVQAFGGVARLQAAYRHAVDAGYRFYSYGDAMFLDLAPPGRRGPR
ncbi:MAG: tRNA preQ1(34) S-adenosylmethionine ribosyltransferase-isomerase QueA [Oligoflexia bacterium]|nr:tRNA preQ1(34) S-adenosylmethionine ribosyltransferase-isomerase QueA [Oligoflexia bacterium]